MSFEGKWVSDKNENFEEYMKEVGVSLLVRKAAANLKVHIEVKKEIKWGESVLQLRKAQQPDWLYPLSHEDLEGCRVTNGFSYRRPLSRTPGSNSSLARNLKKTPPDGRKFKSLIKMVDGKLVHTQTPIKPGDKPSVITRWIEGDRMIVKLESGGVVCRREYVRE
ncbi:hypothetical protein KIN20_035547 [Parelaphostrongylus tenuis]|uniref:Uncharacterized protein n=1 Tax=Parelaphostrongylus tenuis TaxID=148309 RepID=A0AAD5REM4_PARTN|nr:hypothetical protein KIN20_035547 [Parelaphostrongylus tenuis]